MGRVLGGAVAILAGLATLLFVIWLTIGGSERGEAAGWTAIIGFFAVPVIAVPMALGLLFLEGAASWLKRPRVPVLLWGGLVIPLGVALFVGGPWVLASLFSPRAVEYFPAALVFGVAAIVPCCVTCGLYALLTRSTRDA